VLQSHRKPGATTTLVDYLRYAECLRTLFRDDRELVRVRRRMRELSGFMFDGYMKQIRGAAPPDSAR
jgi:hypothetical protein